MVESRSMRYRVKVLGALAVVALLVAWLGAPTFNKWRADNLVDELCAKDGGIKVYETVRIPEERFNRWGQVRVSSREDIEATDKFYYVRDIQWIVAKDESIYGLDLYRYHYSLFRRSGKKLMAEGTGYTRRGGDPVGPWHPSSYTCPSGSGADIKYINQRVFNKKK